MSDFKTIPQYFKSKDVCERLNISDRTLKRIVAAGDLDFIKAPGRTSPLKFTEAAISDYINRKMRI